LKSEEPSPYQSPEDVLRYVQNQPPVEEKVRAFDEQKVYDEIKNACLEGQKLAGEDALWIPWGGYGGIGFMYYSTFGYENYYMALAMYEKEMERLFADAGVIARMRNEVLVKCYEENDFPKFMFGGQDICDNRGPMVSPQLLRRIYFPHMKYAFEPLFKANIKLAWHSDGNIKPIREDLLDAGVGGFQGMQEFMDDPEVNNPLEELAQMTDRHGDPLLIFGSISCRRTLPFGSPDDVRRAAQRCMDICKARGGGSVLFPDNTLGPDIPTENLFALYEYVTTVKAKRHFPPARKGA
jgi:uroporphyrinogen decarboxylase